MSHKVNKNKILLLASIAISFLILLVAFEAFENIRYYKWKAFYNGHGDLYGNLTIASSNKELIWEYRPNGECTTKTMEYKGNHVGIIKTNQYGFRDLNGISTGKSDSTYRVAFVGDSVTLGLWVEENKIFTRVFEIEANKSGLSQKVQALNFGMDGYNTVQIYEMVKAKVLLFSPDKVLYVMCLNDFDLSEASAHKIHYFRKPRSFLIWRLRKAYNRLERFIEKDYHVYHFKKKKKSIFSKILQMKDLLKYKGISFQIVILPVFLTNETNFDAYPYVKIHEEIKEFLKKNRIKCFDLLKFFKTQNEHIGHLAYDIWHPNEEGHRLIAQAMLGPVLSDFLK